MTDREPQYGARLCIPFSIHPRIYPTPTHLFFFLLHQQDKTKTNASSHIHFPHCAEIAPATRTLFTLKAGFLYVMDAAAPPEILLTSLPMMNIVDIFNLNRNNVL